jgi:hypothetical protein
MIKTESSFRTPNGIWDVDLTIQTGEGKGKDNDKGKTSIFMFILLMFICSCRSISLSHVEVMPRLHHQSRADPTNPHRQLMFQKFGIDGNEK